MLPSRSALLSLLGSGKFSRKSFLAISLVFFLAPLFQKASLISLVDASFIAVCFVIAMLLEVSLLTLIDVIEQRIKVLSIVSLFVAAGLLAVNVFHLFIVLTSSPPWAFVAITIVAVLLYCAAQFSHRANAFVVRMSLVLIVVMCGTEVAANLARTQQISSTDRATPSQLKAKQSVYVISFDAMTSRRALSALYGMNDFPHVSYLDGQGFAIYDKTSPGWDTIDSFVEWFSLGRTHTSRNSKFLFNDVQFNPLYALLRERNFRIQFIYHSNYFGVDAGRIDSFFPKHNAISICEFVDRRYLFGACSTSVKEQLWKPILTWLQIPDLLLKNDADGGFQYVAKKLAFPDSGDARKWFSVSYIWFPGHSTHDYSAHDKERIDHFRAQMTERTPQLVPQFEVLINTILQHDPKAAIVFLGDHGGWLSGNASPGDVDTSGDLITHDHIAMDRRDILLAVFPRKFCSNQLGRLKDTALLMKVLADCASSS